MPKVMISGGGTGGHIFPAVAIAQALQSLDPSVELLFVGALGKMEMEKIPAAGYRIVGLPIAGFHRGEILRNLALPFKVIKSLMRARSLVREFRPDVVVGVGGYASGPVLWAAQQQGIPTLIQEQNSWPGITNRWLARRVMKICVAYPGLERFFPADRILLTGNPVRKDMEDLKGLREKGFSHFGFDAAKPLVLITGGSLGARSINRAVCAALPTWVEAGIQVLWQTGNGFAAEAAQVVASVNSPLVRTQPFIQEMNLAFAAATLVVSRAGAGAIAELSLAGKASVLVPLPSAAEDHQTHNAKALTNNSAAVLLSDAACTQELRDTVLDLIRDPARISAMELAIAPFAHPQAAQVIAKEVLNLIQPTRT